MTLSAGDISAPTTVPPSPWQVSGAALIVVGRLPRRSWRALNPERAHILAAPFAGSLAAFSVIHYIDTPVGPYHEFAVSPGIAWHSLPGALVSYMLVDSARSRFGGRVLWGLPKEIAQFTWEDGNVAIVAEAGASLAWVRWRTHGQGLALPVPPLPMLTVRGPRRQFFAVRGWLSGVRRATVTLDIPPESPFVPLLELLCGPHLALYADHFRLHIGTAFDVL
jgi:hypothetical protein